MQRQQGQHRLITETLYKEQTLSMPDLQVASDRCTGENSRRESPPPKEPSPSSSSSESSSSDPYESGNDILSFLVNRRLGGSSASGE